MDRAPPILLVPTTSRALRRALACALACTPLLPAGGWGATVTVRKACVAQWPGQGSQDLPLTVTGLAAGQVVRVDLQVDGKALSGIPSVAADAGGSVATQLTAWTAGLPPRPAGATPARVAVSDAGTGDELGAARVLVTNAALGFDGRARMGDARRVWEVSGLSLFGGGRSYWAHYFRHGELVGRQRLGRPEGSCGYLRTRKVLVPFKRYGTFQVRVQASHRYRSDRPWLGATVTAKLVRHRR